MAASSRSRSTPCGSTRTDSTSLRSRRRDIASSVGVDAVDDRWAVLVEEAIELGTRGDDLYDRAAAIVQAHLVTGGDDPVTWLPQPGG